jgi:hypothetical protein
MASKKPKRPTKASRKVKDLKAKAAEQVKGGGGVLLRACANGVHIKEATITH